MKRLKEFLLNPTEEDMNHIAIILVGLGLIMVGLDMMFTPGVVP